jgi:glycosyltransferase involved in cell wall biosynthesis
MGTELRAYRVKASNAARRTSTDTGMFPGEPKGDRTGMPDNKTLCLNMIVKNEIVNLERCLGSVAPYIACYVIGDTGSTDGTQEFIRSFFAARNIPGELHSFPFINFAQARNKALNHARESKMRFDYLLFTDADMEFTVQSPTFSQGLTSAAYNLLQRSGVTYWNTRLLRRNVPASYKGVTHEYLDLRTINPVKLDGVSFIDYATGSNRVDKYERDIRLLTNAIAAERDSVMISRYTFYLANSLRDSGQKEAAIDAYLKRARLGGWNQEVFISLLNVAELKQALGQSNDEVISAYTKAIAACPTRAEALHAAARFCREKGLYDRGYQFAARGLKIAYPNDGLFVRDWVYEYGLLDELAINAYWTERYAECGNACDQILTERKLPTEMGERVRKNKQFAIDRLQEISARPKQRVAERGQDKVDNGIQIPADADEFIRLLYAARRLEQSGAAVEAVLAAYEAAIAAGPKRGEALHGAARYCRRLGRNQEGMAFARRGLELTRPVSAPHVEDWIYEYGLIEELSITANYAIDRTEKELGFSACDYLALTRSVPEPSRSQAFTNLRAYAESLGNFAPSFQAARINFVPPAGYLATNPSVTIMNSQILVCQRTVNYETDEFAMEYRTPSGDPIRTRNFLLHLGANLETLSSHEIEPPLDALPPIYKGVEGLEDMRIFPWRGDLWCVANCRELTPEGWCEQILARIDRSATGSVRLAECNVMQPEGERRHQKNWMPKVVEEQLSFVYSCDTTRLVDTQGRTLQEYSSPIWAPFWRGGSQLIPFSHGHLALIHEVLYFPAERRRYYLHRFVWFSAEGLLIGITKPFYFKRMGVEFAAGLAWHNDGQRLLISFGVSDRESWIATVSAEDIQAMLVDATNLPDGRIAAPKEEKGTHYWGAFLLPTQAAAPVTAIGQGDCDFVEPTPLTQHARASSRGVCRFKILTCWNTRLFFDAEMGAIRHAAEPDSEYEIFAEVKNGIARLILLSNGEVIYIYISEYSSIASSHKRPKSEYLTCLALDSGAFGFVVGRLFLSADRDGMVRADRPHCRQWEEFRLTDPVSIDDQFDMTASMSREKISGYVISFNRANVLAACLKSIRFVDELIVFDMGSSDGSREIAEKYADKVVDIAWSPVSEPVREFAVAQCSHEIIVFLDDDEILSVDAQRLIWAESVWPAADVYCLPFRSYYLGQFSKRRKDWPEFKDRVFRRNKLTFTSRVHVVSMRASDNVFVIPENALACVHHLSLESVDQWLDKTKRYTSALDRDSWFPISSLPSRSFIQRQIEYWLPDNEIFDDEYAAAYAMLRLVYDFTDMLKRWEKSKGGSIAELLAEIESEASISGAKLQARIIQDTHDG